MRILLRAAGYLWALPNTVLAISLALLLLGRFRTVEGVIEVHGPRIAWALRSLPVRAAALTMGHVVFGVSPAALRATRRHERVHVHQYECWGPAMIPAYLLCAAWLYLRGRDGYRENPFEIPAFAQDRAEE